MKEPNELDDFFSPSSNDKIIQQAKRKSKRRIFLVSGATIVLATLLIGFTKMLITPYYLDKKAVEQQLYYELVGADQRVGDWEMTNRLVGSSATAPIFKIVGDRHVYVGDATLQNATENRHLQPLVGSDDNYNGSRVMHFYHPAFQYDTKANAAKQLAQLQNNEVAEMAISFNEAYTLERLQQLLPSSITLEWNWVDTFTKAEAASNSKEAEEPMNEYEVVGFPMADNQGEAYSQPVTQFVETLQRATEKSGPYKEQFKKVYEAIQGNEKRVTENDVKIVGAVVVGTKQQLTTLMNKTYITASEIGTVVQK
ncbi:anti sigma factor C-terminal domain-containing protein [Kurthia senegalensis]|uniref:anti sigma factor C-terminal domain-containing protein n=1 Tax=Kurthia senegalensis TaxID=1033740 RepID=UPI0002881A35|nr:anti sigma factor C-terminal domain-containing protein [Kurthia senegalensis]